MQKRFFLKIIFFSAAGWLWAEYPVISLLKTSDVLFAQLQNDIQSSYKAMGRAQKYGAPTLAFFRYIPRRDDTIFTLAARCNLPYEVIATLNGFSQAAEFKTAAEILIPNTPGLFVPERPANALEEIMIAWRSSGTSEGEKIVLSLPTGPKTLFFFRGAKFHTVERAYFLKILFLFPLDHAVVSSSFGPRPDPFSGHPSFHQGIDLAAPSGTPVCAPREGVVKAVGYNVIYGNFVRIAHPGGYETLYGHLSAILVKKDQKVSAGALLGRVGVTGRSTGPHLHFEIQKFGKPIDPASFLK